MLPAFSVYAGSAAVRNECNNCRLKILISSVHFTPVRGIHSTKAFHLKHSIHRDLGVLNRFTLLFSQLFSSRGANWHKFSIQ
jgi:hypothetical protein